MKILERVFWKTHFTASRPVEHLITGYLTELSSALPIEPADMYKFINIPDIPADEVEIQNLDPGGLSVFLITKQADYTEHTESVNCIEILVNTKYKLQLRNLQEMVLAKTIGEGESKVKYFITQYRDDFGSLKVGN